MRMVAIGMGDGKRQSVQRNGDGHTKRRDKLLCLCLSVVVHSHERSIFDSKFTLIATLHRSFDKIVPFYCYGDEQWTVALVCTLFSTGLLSSKIIFDAFSLEIYS